MSLLIDGYNLLHVTGIFGRGPGTLEKSRRALLNFLVASIDDEQLAHSAIVFDAQDAPPGLARKVDHQGLQVYFAERDEEADDLIERLIRSHSAPRQLTVVSGDHRLQRAAKRRRANAVDSDRWFEQILRRRGNPDRFDEDSKPSAPLSGHEVSLWLAEFGSAISDEAGNLDAAISDDESSNRIRVDEAESELANPFPPGYAEDLLTEAGDDAIDSSDSNA